MKLIKTILLNLDNLNHKEEEIDYFMSQIIKDHLLALSYLPGLLKTSIVFNDNYDESEGDESLDDIKKEEWELVVMGICNWFQKNCKISYRRFVLDENFIDFIRPKVVNMQITSLLGDDIKFIKDNFSTYLLLDLLPEEMKKNGP